ncbi:DUF4386 family protein [Streptomyces sp. PmtG]
MPHRRIAVLVGFLFISSTITFAVGNSLVQEYFSSTTPEFGDLLAGVILEAHTGLAVAAIGLLLLPVLKWHTVRASWAYLLLRVAECVAIMATGVYFLTSRDEFQDYALLVYAFSGAGGLVLSYALLRSRLVGTRLSVLGVIGYAVLLLGVVADVLGIADLDSGAAVGFYVPGALFEVVFPLVLLFRGFRLAGPASRSADGHVAREGTRH